MFEAVFAGHPVPARRALAGPLSLALHAAALAAVVIGSAWRISDPGEPNVPVVFLTQAPPPPAGGPASPSESRPATSRDVPPARTAVLPRILAAPSAIPVDVAPVEDLPPIAALPAGSGAGSGPGAPGGIDGGIGDGPTAVSGAGDTPIPATAPNVVAPRPLSQAQPEYPETARRARQQGVVLLQAVIGTAGDVEDVRVLSSTSPLFEDAAIRALRQWRYAPATLDRRAVRVYLTVTMKFTLH